MFGISNVLKLNPFSTPDDVRLTLRRQVQRLHTQAVSVDDIEYWRLFWTVPESVYDVLNLISSVDVKKALASYPGNIVNLVINVFKHLEKIVRRSPSFANKASATRSLANYVPGLSVGGSRSGVNADHDIDADKQVLNCLRVLSRVIPFILAHDGGVLEDRLFWSQLPTEPDIKADAGQFVIDDGDEIDVDSSLLTTAPSSPSPNSKSAGSAALQTLGRQLLKMTIDLLYVPHFTLVLESVHQPQTSNVYYQIWENGVGSATALPSSREIERNRIEVLRLLLVLLGKALYISSVSSPVYGTDSYARHQVDALPAHLGSINRWHDLLVRSDSSSGGIPRKVVLTLLCSLMNFALKAGAMHVASTTGLLGAVSGAAGDTYEKLLHGGKRKEETSRVALVRLCLQSLNSILVTSITTSDTGTRAVGPPAAHESGRYTHEQDSLSMPNGGTACNMFLAYIGKIHRQSDIAFISENLALIMTEQMRSAAGKLPVDIPGMTSTSNTSLFCDTLILLWKILDCNPRIAREILSSRHWAHTVICALVQFSLQHKNDDTQHGIIKMAAFVLQTLTAEPAIAGHITSAIHPDVPLPSKYSVTGSLSDFLIQHIYTMIFASKGSLQSVFPAYAITLCNISPFVQQPTVRTSARLVQLFMAMSAPQFLLSDEANPRLLYYLLEALNNIVYWQFHKCPNLMYAIVRSHARFEQVATFTLAEGIASIQTSRQRRTPTAEGGKTHRRDSTASESHPTAGMDSRASHDQNREKISRTFRRDLNSETVEFGGDFSQVSSPTTEYPPHLSDKARGKMPQRSASQLTLHSNGSFYSEENGDIDDVYAYISGRGFRPSEEWVASWRDGLPINTILVMVSELLPKVLSFASLSSDTAVLDYLRTIDIQQSLPTPKPFKARRFVHSEHSQIWLKSTAWGSIYVQSLATFWVWKDTGIKLFTVKAQEALGVQATVSNIMEQGLGMLNMNLGATAGGILSPLAQGRQTLGRRNTGSSVV